MKKVSIIITTYNRRLALERSLRSALGQTYLDVEVLVVDDGSTDGTEDHLKNLFEDKRVRYIKLSNNQGPTAARNKGLDEAVGEYTLVWDSDDLLDPDAVTTLVNIHDRFPTSAIISAPTRVFVNGKQISIPVIPEGELSLETMICAKMPKYKLVRMVSVSQAGDVRYKGRNIDFMYNSELVACGKWIHIQGSLGSHFILSDDNSLTRKRRVPNITRSIERAPYIVAYLERFGARLCKSCPCMYAAHAYGASLGLILDGKKKKARVLLGGAIETCPHLLRCWFVFVLAWLPGAKHMLRALFKIRS